MNNATILATLARVNFHYTNSGLAIFEGTLALTREVLNATTGELVKVPAFLPFQMLGRAAEIAQDNINLGDEVIASGHLNYEEWPNEKGVKRSRIRVKVLNLSPAQVGLPVLQDNSESGPTPRMDGGFAETSVRGNMTALPKVMDTKGGKMVSFQLAVDERFTDRAGKSQTRTHFLPVTLWRSEAEQFLA